jgi:hypothetical protein
VFSLTATVDVTAAHDGSAGCDHAPGGSQAHTSVPLSTSLPFVAFNFVSYLQLLLDTFVFQIFIYSESISASLYFPFYLLSLPGGISVNI